MNESRDAERRRLDVMTVSLAVARGLVPRERAHQALSASAGTGSASRALGLPDSLVREAADPSGLPPAEREECLRVFQELSAPSDGPCAAAGGDRIGTYVVERELGRGGMGVVYQARDPRTGRTVAIKCMLRGDDPTEVARFEREAKTAQRLSHPNIVKVHEVGRKDGKPYLVMELVQGETLSKVLSPHRAGEKRATLERAIPLIRDAARALGHAHAQDIVHRDVKPENIMVDAQGNVRIMDFGLARDVVRGVTVTATGGVIGTPRYMSPEQAGGRRDRIGPPSDVWALGVMLYEAAAHSLPFDGETAAEVLHKITHDEVVPVRRRNPRVSPALEAVILKCLESEPVDRYPTATQVAEELDRYLERVPVLARAPGFWKRLRRKAARRRGLVLASAGGLVAVALVAAILLPTLGSAKREAGEAAKKAVDLRSAALVQLRETTGAALSAALGFRQQGRLEEMRKYLKQTEIACRKAIAELPDHAEPHYRLGRMYRALLKDEDALAEQERALVKEARYAPARYERIVLIARRYRETAERLYLQALRQEGRRVQSEGGGRITGGKGLTVPSMDELARKDPEGGRLRSLMEEDLRAIEGRAEGIGEAESLCARGLMAWATREYSRGRELLAAGLKKDPSLEEGWEALGKLEELDGRYEEAIRALSAASERDRGYFPLRESLGMIRANWGTLLGMRGEDTGPTLAAALSDFDRVLELDPGRRRSRVARAIVRSVIGSQRQVRGEDPTAFYRSACEDLEESLRQGSQDAEPWIHRGRVRGDWAIHAADHGGDAEPLFRGAVEDLGEALKRDPAAALPWFSRGVVQMSWANAAEQQGSDSVPRLQAALKDLEEALQRNPSMDQAWWYRGKARVSWGQSLKRRGQDALPQYAAALADYHEAVKVGADHALNWMGRGMLQSDWGVALHERNQDPSGRYAAAIKDFDQALALNPGGDEAWMYRGRARFNWGVWRQGSEEGPVSTYRDAIDDFTQAVKRNPGSVLAWEGRSAAYSYWGSYRVGRDEDPSEQYRAAIESADGALKVAPDRVEAWFARGSTYYNWARLKVSEGRKAGEEHRAALEALEKVVALDPRRQPRLRTQMETCRQYLAANPEK